MVFCFSALAWIPQRGAATALVSVAYAFHTRILPSLILHTLTGYGLLFTGVWGVGEGDRRQGKI